MNEGDERYDEKAAELLRRRHGRLRARLGSEPEDLERVARWVDGGLTGAEAEAISRRVAADPELAEVVARLAVIEAELGAEGGPHRPASPSASPGSNVVSLADHRARSGETVSAPPLAAGPAGRRRPDVRRIVLGIGGALAIAAIAFLVTRPPAAPSGVVAGAGVGVPASASGLASTRLDRASCTIAGQLSTAGAARLWYVSAQGVTDLGRFAPGPFEVRAPACAVQACEQVVATAVGSPAPTVDPSSCALGSPALGAVRLGE